MLYLIVIIASVLAVLIIEEIATAAVIGWPILREKDAELVRKLLPDACTAPPHYDIFHLNPSGYISTCGWSPFGTLYCQRYSLGIIRIPRWTPLYREIQAKFAELNKQEG